jgi:hypothetical protein
MQSITSLSEFAGHLRDLIRGTNAESSWPDELFGDLALKLFVLQCTHNDPYRKLCEANGTVQGPKSKVQTANIADWRQIPALPTSAFKDFDLTCLAPQSRTTVFHSSGTTEHRPSRHFHNAESLRVYKASLIAAFSQRLDASSRPTIISLTPRPELAPNSSLVYMFQTFCESFGDDHSTFVGRLASDGGWALNGEVALQTLRQAIESAKPVLILGTAFLYVHLLDYLDEIGVRLELPPGSHVLETGGYKARSRIIPKDELHRSICERLGIASANIICEYGMSELSSQAYDNNPEGIESFSPGLRGTSYPGSEPSKIPNPERVAPNRSRTTVPGEAARPFHFRPWTRVQIISPETGREVNEGETGLIRVFDLANVFSVMAIQTEDLAIKRGDGFELIGRAALAEARGCSLMAV